MMCTPCWITGYSTNPCPDSAPQGVVTFRNKWVGSTLVNMRAVSHLQANTLNLKQIYYSPCVMRPFL